MTAIHKKGGARIFASEKVKSKKLFIICIDAKVRVGQKQQKNRQQIVGFKQMGVFEIFVDFLKSICYNKEQS